MRRGGELAGAMPLYLKSHSRGEYVFDHGWADAFARHGIQYYPKLLSAVPFTPVTGPRLLAPTHADRVLLARGAIEFAKQLEVSSIHVLFSHEDDLDALTDAGFMLREGVQFHWENFGYKTFDEFLSKMSHDKRKKLKQDRRRVHDAGVTFRWLRGQEISQDDLDFFYECYPTVPAVPRPLPLMSDQSGGCKPRMDSPTYTAKEGRCSCAGRERLEIRLRP